MSAPSAVNLDQTTADAIRTALENTLSGMFHIPVSCGEHSIGKGPFDGNSCTTGMLEMRQAGQLIGIFIIAFSPGVVQQIQSVFGVSQAGDVHSTRDGIEEMVNVIYGDIKKTFNQNGYHLRMDFPRILDGANAFFEEHAEDERIVVPFLAGGCKCHASIMTVRRP